MAKPNEIISIMLTNRSRRMPPANAHSTPNHTTRMTVNAAYRRTPRASNSGASSTISWVM